MPWYGEERAKARRMVLAGQVKAMLELVRDRHRANLAKAFPPASKSGEYPRRRTGRLLRAVDYAPKSVAELAAGLVGTVFYDGGAPYAKHLSARGRRSIRDTVRAMRGELAALAARAGRG